MLPLVCCGVVVLALAGCGSDGSDGDDGQEDAAHDAAVSQAEAAGRDAEERGPIAYFFIFSSGADAKRAEQELAQRGFTINREYSASFAEEGSDETWLVVERIDTLADLEETERLLEQVAERNNGVYDGWEAATGP